MPDVTAYFRFIQAVSPVDLISLKLSWTRCMLFSKSYIMALSYLSSSGIFMNFEANAYDQSASITSSLLSSMNVPANVLSMLGFPLSPVICFMALYKKL